MDNRLEEAARILHTNIMYGEDASYKQIKLAISLIFEAAKEEIRKVSDVSEKSKIDH